MPLENETDAVDLAETMQLLRSIETRISYIEEYLGIEEEVSASPESLETGKPEEKEYARHEEKSGFEFKFGQFGLAWLGSFVLLLGIVFLMTYTYAKGYTVLSSVLGYVATAGFFAIARKWRNSLPHLSAMLAIVSHLLLYYTTLRLHFFADQPLVENRIAAIILLLTAVGIQFYFAYRENSELLAGLAIFLGMATALFSDTTHFCLLLIAVFSALSVFMFLRQGWSRQVIATLLLAYLAHLLWLLNNPVMGRPIQAVTAHQNNLIYLFLYAVIFSWPSLLRERETISKSTVAALTFHNGGGFSVMSLLVVLAFFQANFVGIALAGTVFFLAFSMIQWQRTHRQFEPAFYACFGFTALTVAVFGYTKVPAAYFWLSLQSLLVVSMALWYRSRIIVVVNTFIYLVILLAYLVTEPAVNAVNFSFAVTALASARIMNWQKERLTLQTEMLRNMYLAVAFVAVLYGLYHAVPGHYVTLSWALAAVGYFLLSLWLHRIKYRWLAIFTMIAAVGYLFFVDLARLEAGYRVLAFLFLGLILLAGSLFYTKFRHRLKR
ncbi:MAG: hypothetical protein ACE5I1_08140 [bacterium]